MQTVNPVKKSFLLVFSKHLMLLQIHADVYMLLFMKTLSH